MVLSASCTKTDSLLILSGYAETKEMKTRWVVSSLSLLVVASTLLALSVACAVRASESPLTHDDYVRMCHARDAVWWTSTFIALTAAWLVFGLRESVR